MKKLITTVAMAAVLVGTLTGCTTKTDTSNREDNVIRVAASATPHAEILEAAKEALKEKGYTLEIRIFDDYIIPNEVVESGEFDANYFQHVQYLNSYNEEHKTNLVIAGKIHYEPFGIYPGKRTDLTSLTEGDVIAVPNDSSNETRALKLLEEYGIITLKDGVDLKATVTDIAENPFGVKFEELEAAQIPRVREEVALSVINGNYALASGLSVTEDSVVYESADSDNAKTYVNVVAVKEGMESSDKIKALVEVLKSDAIQQFINENYKDSVLVFTE